MNIHTIREVATGWSVGYWLLEHPRADKPYQAWKEICQFKDIGDALNRVNILNGGPGHKP